MKEQRLMKEQKAYGFIHCHSDYSTKDSPLKIKDLVKGASDMGAKAITLTDHGICTGLIEFIEECKANDIKPIPGVEAYVSTEFGERCHMILLAKNYEGYRNICKAVTLSNKDLDKKSGYPLMDKEILQSCFSDGNVIATSACVSGILSSVILFNDSVKRKKRKLEKKMQKYSSSKEDIDRCKSALDIMDEEIKKQINERNILNAFANKKYTTRIKGLKTLENDIEAYNEAKEILDREIAQTENAKIALPELKQHIADLKKKRTSINRSFKKQSEIHEKFTQLKNEYNSLDKEMVSDEILNHKLDEEIQWFNTLFKDNFYIEMQYHGMKDEKKVMQILCEKAKKFNIPLVAANDIHILRKEDAEARQLMKSLRFEKYEEISPYDRELYMKTDSELLDALCKILSIEDAQSAIRNVRTICDSCDFEIPEDTHYPKYIDHTGKPVEDSGMLLRKLAEEGIDKFGREKFSREYRERMNDELDTIISMGFADYLLIVQDYINYARNLSIEKGNGIGYGVGPGRGSGTGSLVNSLLGITSKVIDPLQYGLKFERFLNKARVSMPDIDADFSEEVRAEAIKYVSQKYGVDCTAGIRTNITQGSKMAVRNAARCLDWKIDYDNLSVLNKSRDKKGQELLSKLPKENKSTAFAALADTIAKNINGSIEESKTNLPHFPCDKKTGVTASNIISKAELIEGTSIGLGVHAAGIIISDGKPLSDYIPLLYNTKKQQWAVQCDMIQAEGVMKLLKMDFLGLNNLDILTEAIRRIYKNTGKKIDLEKIPFEEEVFNKIFAQGKTGCVFQFESSGMKNMLKQFKPDCFEDIILLVAAYRPGPMDSIPAIIDAKHGRKKTTYNIKGLEKILAPTYGQTIYQEQLMDIFHECAGFSMEEADIIRKYMSKKKVDKFLAYKPKFVQGIISNGASENDAISLWDSLVGFAKYAFNKSHAAAYALISYQTAYLKYHYPSEYMCAVLNHTDIKKLPTYLHECRMTGLKICPPDINKSLTDFEDRGENIIYGLGHIKGISNSSQEIIDERQKNGLYSSFTDFLLRTSLDSDVTKALIATGCFERIIPERREILENSYELYAKNISIIKEKTKLLDSLESENSSDETEKEKKSRLKKIENAKKAINNANVMLKNINIERAVKDDKSKVLAKEKELLGAYISGHPLDNYNHFYSNGKITTINNMQNGEGNYIGLINDLKIIGRKSDGKKMAFFTFEDLTGTVHAACFVNEYNKYKKLINEGMVVEIYADAKVEINEDNIETKELIVKKVSPCRPFHHPYLMTVKNMDVFQNTILPLLSPYRKKGKRNILVHVFDTGEIIQSDVYVNDDIYLFAEENKKICVIRLLDI